MPKAEDGVETIDPSAPEGGSKDGSAAPQDISEVIKERDQWKEAALKAKRQNRESKSETEDERIARIATEAAAKAVNLVTEDSILKSKVTDPEQRKLVKDILDSRIKRTGTSEEALAADIEDALNLANSKKFVLENKELKRLHANDSRVPPAAGSGADRGVERKTHEWTLEQEKMLEAKAKTLKLDPEKFKTDSWKNRSRTNVA